MLDLVHTPQYLFFRVVDRCTIWFVSKKVLARLDIKPINKNKVSRIVLCLFDYKCITEMPTYHKLSFVLRS